MAPLLILLIMNTILIILWVIFILLIIYLIVTLGRINRRIELIDHDTEEIDKIIKEFWDKLENLEEYTEGGNEITKTTKN